MDKNQFELPRYFDDCELRYVEGPDGKPRFTGYAAVYNVRSVDLGGFIEVIAPGAFSEVLGSKQEVLALVEHDPFKPLGRRSVGTLTMRDESRGLYVEIDPPNTTLTRDTIENVRSRTYTGMSFRFPRGAKDSWKLENGVPVRTIHKCGLKEVTITAMPAYEATSVALRSVQANDGDELRSYYAAQIEALKPNYGTLERRLRLMQSR